MDETLFYALNDLANIHWVASLGVLLSSKWMLLFVLGPVAIYLSLRRRFLPLLVILVAMGAGDAFTSRVLKPTFARERPCRTLEHVTTPTGCGPGRSFPSGHATIAFAFLTTAAPVVPFGWAVLTPLASGVASSRVLLGVHYPSDVLGGSLVGALIGLGLRQVQRWLERRRDLRQRERQQHEATGP